MIPAICIETTTLHAYIELSMGVQRVVSVRAVALPNLIDKKSCERERFTMRMSAAAQCCRRGAVVGLYHVWPTRSTSCSRAP